MLIFVVVVILLALLGVLGAVIKGLLWVALIAALLLLAAAGFGYFKLRTWNRDSA